MDGWVVPTPLVPQQTPMCTLLLIAINQRPELAARRAAIRAATDWLAAPRGVAVLAHDLGRLQRRHLRRRQQPGRRSRAVSAGSRLPTSATSLPATTSTPSCTGPRKNLGVGNFAQDPHSPQRAADRQPGIDPRIEQGTQRRGSRLRRHPCALGPDRHCPNVPRADGPATATKKTISVSTRPEGSAHRVAEQLQAARAEPLQLSQCRGRLQRGADSTCSWPWASRRRTRWPEVPTKLVPLPAPGAAAAGLCVPASGSARRLHRLPNVRMKEASPPQMLLTNVPAEPGTHQE